MEKICKLLFGETKTLQKRKIKKLLCITVILGAVSIFLALFDSTPTLAIIFFMIIILMWGWKASFGLVRYVADMLNLFGNDIAILFISVVLWVTVGLVLGVCSFIIGMIQLVQISKENK